MADIEYKQYKILLVDDEQEYLENMKMELEDDFSLITANSAEEALKILEQDSIAVILSDQKMPGIKGTQLLSDIKEKYPAIVRVLITGYTDLDAAIEAINQGDVYRYIQKTSPLLEINNLIKQAIEKYHLQKERDQLYNANQMLLKKLATHEKVSAVGAFGEVLYERLLPLLEDLRILLTKDQILSGANNHKSLIESITTSIKTFDDLSEISVKSSMGVKEIGNLNRIVKEMVDYYKTAEGWEQVKINTSLDNTLPDMEMNVDRIDYALERVFLNAGQAIADNGTISISTCMKDIDGKKYAVIEVADNGCGIEKDDLEKVFIPFFTTKAGRGYAGLGLTVAECILNKHNATIEVKSDYPNSLGTTVIVTIPVE